MIDNLEVIKPLLKFDSEDDFYYLQILQRKKENPDLGSNSRVIKNYYIRSIDYLEERYGEIKKLCEVFNARAMLRLNKRSYEKVAFKTLLNTTNSIMNKEFTHTNKAYDRACGQIHNDKNKKWILDIDGEFENKWISEMIGYIEDLQPTGSKLYTTITTKNGIHLITKPFNLEKFRKDYSEVEVHKDNPVNLYIP